MSLCSNCIPNQWESVCTFPEICMVRIFVLGGQMMFIGITLSSQKKIAYFLLMNFGFLMEVRMLAAPRSST